MGACRGTHLIAVPNEKGMELWPAVQRLRWASSSGTPRPFDREWVLQTLDGGVKKEVVENRRKVTRDRPLLDGHRGHYGGESRLVQNILWTNSLQSGKLQIWPKNEERKYLI